MKLNELEKDSKAKEGLKPSPGLKEADIFYFVFVN